MVILKELPFQWLAIQTIWSPHAIWCGFEPLLARMVAQILLVTGHSKNRWSWFSSPLPQKRQPRAAVGVCKWSWVPRRPLIASQRMNVVFGIALENHTKLCQVTSYLLHLKASQQDLVVNVPEGDGNHLTWSPLLGNGVNEGGITFFTVSNSR